MGPTGGPARELFLLDHLRAGRIAERDAWPIRLAALMQRVPSEMLAGMPKTPQRACYGVFGLSSVSRSRVDTHHPSG